MKIESIKITVAEEVLAAKKVQAYLVRYDIDRYRDYDDIYSLGDPTYRPYRQPKITLEFLCPRCGAEYVVKMRIEKKEIEMTCTCGLPLTVWPEAEVDSDRRPRNWEFYRP